MAVFNGAHGISAIASVSIMPSDLGKHPEIISVSLNLLGCYSNDVLKSVTTLSFKLQFLEMLKLECRSK
jgi:hypothetical protein